MTTRAPVAITTSSCNCKPSYVCLIHQTDWPNGAPSCAGCGDALDPILWRHGLHLGCDAPADVPTAVAAIDAAVAAGASAPWMPGEREQMLADASSGPPTAVEWSSNQLPAAPAPSPFVRPAGPPPAHPLKAELVEIVRWVDRNRPRPPSQQINMWPSDLGADCMRRLAYRFLGAPTVNADCDPWFSIVGTAVHDWLDTAINRYQVEVLGVPPVGSGGFTDGRRYLTEERVRIAAGQFDVSGRCDLYDAQRQTVVDHKIVGPTTMKKCRNDGPGNQYRVQVHTYGLGYELAGRPVAEVAIAFYPRSGYLTDLYVWAEPYNRQVALDALGRANTVKTLAALLPVGSIPSAPDPVGCTWCPFYRPGGPADETGCPGATVQNGA